MTSKKHKSKPASTANTDRKKKSRPQVLPTLRGEQSGYYQYQLDSNSHPLQPRKGEFCPFIIPHIIKYVKKIGGKINEDRSGLRSCFHRRTNRAVS